MQASDKEHADSLFVQKKYTQAFKIYDSLYHQSGLQSAQMLMRMAFIKEGLNDYTNAIYYLNRYHELTYDEKAIEKIASLAESHRLKGYTYDDRNFFETLFNRYKTAIMWALLGLALLIFGISMITWLRKRRFAFSSLIAIILLSLAGYAISLLPDFRKTGILTQEALLYQLPSSGSEVLEKAEKGRKVRILDEIDVWYVVALGEGQAYIKNSYVREM